MNPKTARSTTARSTLTASEREKIGMAIEDAARDGAVEWLIEHYLDTCNPSEAREWLVD